MQGTLAPVAFVACLAALGAAACAGLIGIDEPFDRPDGGPSADGASEGPAATDGHADVPLADGRLPDGALRDGLLPDGVSPTDAPASDGCVPSGTEVCDDGNDNDCNGLIDCADPACTAMGYVCVPAPAAGWTFALIDPTDTASCPAGWTSKDVVASASGGGSCGQCACTAENFSCNIGTLIAAEGGPGAGGNQCQDGTHTYQAGGCQNAPGVVPNYLNGTPLTGNGGGDCAPSPPSPNIPPPTTSPWRICSAPAGALGGGCGAGSVCALTQGALSRCVTQGVPGAACPSGYTMQTTVGAGANAVNDTRHCTACGCSGLTLQCTSGQLQYFNAVGCNPVDSLSGTSLNGMCNAIGTAGLNYFSYQYAATAMTQCSVTAQSQLTGTVSVNGAITTCCR